MFNMKIEVGIEYEDENYSQKFKRVIVNSIEDAGILYVKSIHELWRKGYDSRDFKYSKAGLVYIDNKIKHIVMPNGKILENTGKGFIK